MLSDSNARLVAARRLTSRRGRQDSGLFLAEGAPSVLAASAAGRAVEIFATSEALERHADAFSAGVPVAVVSPKAAASLSETVSPQGLVAVCSIDEPGSDVAGSLAVVLVECNDPGNAGTIVRTSDAAGASMVIFAGEAVDPYNGKCVRASAGSLFHVPIKVCPEPAQTVLELHAAGLRCLAATGGGVRSLDELRQTGELAGPTAWIFGNEARGLSPELIAASDDSVRVPIYGRAESLNLAAAAAVCLYASAQEQSADRRGGGRGARPDRGRRG